MTDTQGSPSEKEWQEKVKRILKSEIAAAGVTYEELSRRLKVMGVQDIAPSNLTNKISRGTFSATFLLQCLEAVGSKLIISRPFLRLSKEELDGLAADAERGGEL